MRQIHCLTLLVLLLSVLVACSGGGSINGKALSVTGNVTANGSALISGQQLAPGSVIVTAGNSVCDIQFSGRNLIRVQESTEVKLNLNSSNRLLELKTGSIECVLPKLEKLPGKNTPLLVAESSLAEASVISPGAFFMKAETDSTYICVCNGSIGVSDILGVNGFQVSAKHHSSYLYKQDKKGSSFIATNVLYHDDASMESAARANGSSINWNK